MNESVGAREKYYRVCLHAAIEKYFVCIASLMQLYECMHVHKLQVYSILRVIALKPNDKRTGIALQDFFTASRSEIVMLFEKQRADLFNEVCCQKHLKCVATT